jgi:glycosyltransferase involved in cell wall biosynthesis
MNYAGAKHTSSHATKTCKKVLFLVLDSAAVQHFVRKDIELLSKHCRLKVVEYPGNRKVYRIIQHFLWADVYFSWFGYKQAAVSAWFGRLLGKRSIVVAGGFDAVNMPEIQYGLLGDRYRKKWAIRAFKYSTCVLAVSNSIKDDVVKNCDLNSRQESRIRVVYHGFDSTKYHPCGEKENLVITVGIVNKSNLLRKGHECFIRSASRLPQYRFVLIGRDSKDGAREYLQSIAGSNVTILDYIPFEELLGYMQRAKVYVQVSAHEGFGCSLAEAMLCECIPVVSDRGAIPEVVATAGYIVPFNDPAQTAAAIVAAMEGGSRSGAMARGRIARLFPLENRERQLIEAINH